jgi:hypothetical protein
VNGSPKTIPEQGPALFERQPQNGFWQRMFPKRPVNREHELLQVSFGRCRRIKTRKGAFQIAGP